MRIYQRECSLAVIEFFVDRFLAIVAGTAVCSVLLDVCSSKHNIGLAMAVGAIGCLKRSIIFYMAILAGKC